jgi:hypothetical protein
MTLENLSIALPTITFQWIHQLALIKSFTGMGYLVGRSTRLRSLASSFTLEFFSSYQAFAKIQAHCSHFSG